MSEQTLEPGWKTWRFEQMAVNVNDRIDNPSESGLERFVGLEHLDTDSLKIWRWGSTSDVEKTKLLFKKGDIIFGRRNAYLRRVAVADFDGVCSAHAMVLRARPDVVLPEFLPFFMQTNTFWETALKVSAGSMSPTINWSNIAKEEFALPPLDEQYRLASLLKAIVICCDSLFDLVNSCLSVEVAFLKDNFGNYTDQQHIWPRVELQQIASIQTGIAKGGKQKQGEMIELPYLAVSNVHDGYLDLSDVKTISVEHSKIDRYLLQNGDVLLTEGGDPDKLGRGTVWQGEIANCVHQNHIFAVRPDSVRLNSWFLAALARSIYGKQYFLRASKRTSNLATINKQQVGAFLVPLPSSTTQENFVTKWLALRHSTEQAHSRLQNLLGLQASLMRDVMKETK